MTTSEPPSTYEPTTDRETLTPTTENIAFITMTGTLEDSPTDQPSHRDRYDHLFPCAEEFQPACLNGGTCMAHNIITDGKTVEIKHCECSSHYKGEFCEYKELEGTYLSKTKRSIRTNDTEPREVSRMFNSCDVFRWCFQCTLCDDFPFFSLQMRNNPENNATTADMVTRRKIEGPRQRKQFNRQRKTFTNSEKKNCSLSHSELNLKKCGVVVVSLVIVNVSC